MSLRRLRRPFRRTFATAAVAVLAVVATGLGGAPAASGEEPGEPFVIGSGRSEARLVRVGPSAGQLSLAPVIGLALTDHLNNLARAESRLADYAALESSLPPELIDAAPSLKVTSTDEGGGEGKVVTTAGTPEGSPATVGATRQSARADATPHAEAAFELGALDLLPGVVEVGNGLARSSTEVIEGATRAARGVTTFGTVSLGDGAVVLQGLRWEAVQRTGREETVSGGFSIEGIQVGGQALPLPSDPGELAPLFEQVNATIAPLGLQLVAPVVTTDGGVARISPLMIRGGGSELGNTVLAPAIGALQPVREPVADALIGANPEFATAFLLADVTLGVLSGGSAFEIQLGGASAFTEGEAFEDPLGGFELGAGPDVLGTIGPGLGTGTPVSAGTVGAGAIAGIPGTPGTPGVATPGAATAPVSVARSVGAQLAGRTIPGTRGGAAALVGFLGLLGALGMAVADWQRLRGGSRTIPVDA